MRRVSRVALVAAVLTVAVPAAADAMLPADMMMSNGQTTPVQIGFDSYGPANVTVLAGDTVLWDDISRTHTVTAADNSWSSPHLNYGDSFSRMFDAAGTFSYYCQIHTFMHGTVDVEELLLAPQPEAVQPRSQIPLRGRAALPPGSEVTIEGDSGGGYSPVASTTVGPDGTFAVTVAPATTTTYRADSGGTASPPVLVTVIDRKVLLTHAQHGGRDVFNVTVTPPSPGASVVLQLYLRNRFGWWPQLFGRLNRASRATFTLRLSGRTPVRAALTLKDDATVLALSRVIRAG